MTSFSFSWNSSTALHSNHLIPSLFKMFNILSMWIFALIYIFWNNSLKYVLSWLLTLSMPPNRVLEVSAFLPSSPWPMVSMSGSSALEGDNVERSSQQQSPCRIRWSLSCDFITTQPYFPHSLTSVIHKGTSAGKSLSLSPFPLKHPHRREVKIEAQKGWVTFLSSQSS